MFPSFLLESRNWDWKSGCHQWLAWTQALLANFYDASRTIELDIQIGRQKRKEKMSSNAQTGFIASRSKTKHKPKALLFTVYVMHARNPSSRILFLCFVLRQFTRFKFNVRANDESTEWSASTRMDGQLVAHVLCLVVDGLCIGQDVTLSTTRKSNVHWPKPKVRQVTVMAAAAETTMAAAIVVFHLSTRLAIGHCVCVFVVIQEQIALAQSSWNGDVNVWSSNWSTSSNR